MLNGYNSKLEATLPVEFFTSAFRFGHSLIPSALERWSTTHKFIGSRRLSEIINKPFDVYNGDVCDQYLTGFMNQISQAVDDSVSQEVTQHFVCTINWTQCVTKLSNFQTVDQPFVQRWVELFRLWFGLIEHPARSWSRCPVVQCLPRILRSPPRRKLGRFSRFFHQWNTPKIHTGLCFSRRHRFVVGRYLRASVARQHGRPSLRLPNGTHLPKLATWRSFLVWKCRTT